MISSTCVAISIEADLIDVEDLAAQRADRLERRVAPLLEEPRALSPSTIDILVGGPS